MPLVPEKLNSRQEVRNAIASQFWDQPVHSGRSVDGVARTLACEPPPPGQTAASGLLRSQELLITQAAGVPVMPGYSEHNGGLVFDRVLAKLGRKQWWANLTGRVKGQQMWSEHRAGATVGDTVKDLNNYSLSARTKFSIGRNGSVNAVVEAPNVEDFRECIEDRMGRVTKRRRTVSGKPALKSQAWAKYQLPGFDIVGTAAWNQDHLDSAANYSTVPLSMSLDLASKDRPEGLQYRVGVHQVSAPEIERSRIHSFDEALPFGGGRWRSSLHAQGAVAMEGEGHLWRPGRRAAAASASTSASASSGSIGEPVEAEGPEEAKAEISREEGQRQAGQPSTSYSSEQAPTAISGSALGVSASASTAASDPSQQQKQEKPAGSGTLQTQARGNLAQISVASSRDDKQTATEQPTREASKAAGSKTSSSRHDASQSQHSLPAPLPAASRPSAATRPSHAQPQTSIADASSPADQSRASSSQAALSQAGASQAAQQQGTATAHVPPARASPGGHSATGQPGSVRTQKPWPLMRRRRKDGSQGILLEGYSTVVSDSEDSDYESTPQPEGRLLGDINANQIQTSIHQAQSNVDKLRQILNAVNIGYQEGKAQQQHQRQLALSRQNRPVPYSPWLSQPFLKVNAAIGILARMPLPHSAFRPWHTGSGPASSKVVQHLNKARSRFGSELWSPYLRDTALKMFGSVGLTGQLGHFSRPALDFTAGSVRLDFGLTAPHHVNSLAAASSYGNLPVFNPRDDHQNAASPRAPAISQPLSMTRFKNRAFALEGRGIWHALSASITQQVLGPIRARADFRYALDLPSGIPLGDDGKRHWIGILDGALQVRPTLLETVYGLDVIVPGSKGIARAAVWYSPARKEGMAEIKLF